MDGYGQGADNRGRGCMTEEQSANARRVHELRVFARDAAVVPILVQRDPDPDGMASALGIRMLLHRSDQESPIVSLGEVTRPENRRMAELLDLRVTRVTDEELSSFDRVIAVDTQPDPAPRRTRFAVIDHHPPRKGFMAEFLDIRPDIGAVATMVTGYLRSTDEERITPRLATALLYGIRTDTDVLRRGTAAADIEAYAFLQGVADAELLRKIARPAFSEQAIAAVGHALVGLRTEGDVAVAFAGRLDERAAHVLPNLADFCLAVEGVSWSAVGGLIGDEFAVNIRRSGAGPGAGDLARSMAAAEGKGGGHHTMARVGFSLDASIPSSDQPGDARTTEWLLGRVRDGIESLAALR
jgi:nanoRNase/pAp phosphatase (c-di-AMP/oligoRNAs hydrolase)